MKKELKVGLFLGLGFLLTGMIVFLVGDNRGAFDRKVHFKTAFKDVAGLKAGAPVRMGGVDIGSVGQVGYAEESKDQRIHVSLSVVKRESGRVRTDSVA